jgi:hypothetical protein
VLQGTFYATHFAIEYPAGTEYSECVVTCADGFELLSLDNLGTLDPPDAQTYSDVVAHDRPFVDLPLSETRGTAMVPVQGSNLRRDARGRLRVVETQGAGEKGVYKENPTLGIPSDIATGIIGRPLHPSGSSVGGEGTLAPPSLVVTTLSLG